MEKESGAGSFVGLQPGWWWWAGWGCGDRGQPKGQGWAAAPG